MATVLITGTSRGIGLGLAAECAARGWRVVATCRGKEISPALASLRAQHEAMDVCLLDVTDDDGIEALGTVLAGESIDVLVSNAAAGGRSAGLAEVAYEAWAMALRVNAFATLKMAQVFVEQVARSERRLIMAISSRMGSIAETRSGGRYAYRASKAALNMTVRTLAADLAPRGVTVVAVHPGWVRTATGGPGAPISVETSAHDIADLMTGITTAQTGLLLDRHGRTLPW